jgi:Ca-activated chloride channel family protein
MRSRDRVETVALVAVLVLAGLGVPAPAAAQGWIEPLPRVASWGVVKLGTDVTVTVEGRVAEVVVEEWFENRGALGEGDYLYALPGEAVFSNFSLYQGDRELRGETMNAEEARRIYEEIVRRQRDPALIELVGHGLVRARVFPFQPGERRRITLRYTQILERAGESVQFRYVAGRRNAAGPVPGTRPLPVRVAPPSEGGEAAPVRFRMIVSAAEYAEPFSPTHGLEVERRGGRLEVRPAGPLTGDLSVFLPVATDGVRLTVATHRPAGEDGYFMLTLSPGEADGDGTPRDVTAVVDVSGSMSGGKLDQTRSALHQLLGSLGQDDRFRLVAFSNRVRVSSDGWSTATATELQAARRWIDGLEADGGTNIAGALAEALRLESPEDRLPITLFLTDGLPTVGERDPEKIAAEAESHRGRARVFAFGVGYDVNTYLLDRLGEAGRGSTEYVEPGEDVERAVATLAAKVTHPVLTDVELVGAPVRLTEIQPGRLPDLFAGEELVIFGRYEGAGEGRVRVRGRRAGRRASFAVTGEFPARAQANDFIPRLWASRKLGELTREIRIHGPDEELEEAIRRLAARYGLLSEYTSYLVREPEALLGATPVRLEAARAGLTAAPAAATGQGAVRASKRAEARRRVASAADLAVAEAEAAEELADHGLRVVAGRTFRQVDGVWLEAGGEPDEPVIVKLYSGAYFELLRALPELRSVVAELTPVTVRGEDVWLGFDEAGRESLDAVELDRLVARFRGL